LLAPGYSLDAFSVPREVAQMRTGLEDLHVV
jgi:hypothetical protein